MCVFKKSFDWFHNSHMSGDKISPLHIIFNPSEALNVCFFSEYRLQLKTENNIKNVIIHFEMFCSRPFKICWLILKFALLLLNKQFTAFWFWRYYAITAFDEADIMIYQPWKFDIHWGKWLIYFKMHPKYFWVIIISFRSLSMEWIKQHINVEHIWWYVASHRVLANQKQEI